MRRLGRAELIKTGKIAVGCCLAYTAASLLGLRYATSAVTITLLSIQNTRRDTFRLAGRRSCAFLTALAVSFAVFSTAGYTVLSLGVFLLVFALLCHLFGLMDGLSMSTVLVLHFWSAGAMTLSAVLNELILMAIGIVMGIVMNLYMPRELDAIRADQRRIDETVREILLELSERVVASTAGIDAGRRLEELDKQLETAHRRASAYQNNSFSSDTRYFVQYVELRRRQWRILSAIYRDLPRLSVVPYQANVVANFMKLTAYSLHECNNAAVLLEELKEVRTHFQHSRLPATREEFETRAVLVEIVHQIQHLLEEKKFFAESLTPSQIRRFWVELLST